MRISKVVPDAPGAASGTLIYVCNLCRTETTRRHKGAELREWSETEQLQCGTRRVAQAYMCSAFSSCRLLIFERPSIPRALARR